MIVGAMNPFFLKFNVKAFGCLQGPEASHYENDAIMLAQGVLPRGWRWIKSAANSMVAHFQQKPEVYFKAFLSRGRIEGLKSIIRGSRCKRAIRQSNILQANGFQAPTVLCWGKVRNKEIMLTAAVNGIGFGDYIASYLRRPKRKYYLRWKRHLIRCLGKEIGRLHRCGIVHGDLRPNNILVVLGSYEPHFFFIDNERNRQYQKIPLKLIQKNLVQINMMLPIDLCLTDRLRFFDAYLHRYGRFTEMEAKKLMSHVQRRTLERLAGKKLDTLVDASLSKELLQAGLIVPDENIES